VERLSDVARHPFARCDVLLRMLERDVARDYRKALRPTFNVEVPNDRARGGWPDSIVQADSGIIAAIELKHAEMSSRGTFTMPIRPDQINWLWRWSHRGPAGLFFGLHVDGVPAHYGFFLMPHDVAVAHNLRRSVPLAAAAFSFSAKLPLAQRFELTHQYVAKLTHSHKSWCSMRDAADLLLRQHNRSM
jgi:hypothetical protein